MPFRDKEQKRLYMREYRKVRMTQEQKTHARRRISDRKKELVEWFQELKETFSCKICGENDACCLDFHHREPGEKDFFLSKAIWDHGCGKERVLEEIGKCDCLCANCHRKLHKRLKEGV